jgi:hypothetical protein
MPWGKRTPRAGARKCEYEWEDDPDRSCGAYALRDSDPPRCRIHSMTPEEVSAASRRAAARSAVVRHGDVESAPRLSGLDPGVTLAELLPIIREALAAKFDYTNEIDWNTRLAAVGTLLSAFPREYRRTPEDCAELIRRAIPPEIRSPEMEDARKVYAALRESWDAIDGLRYSALKGLWVARYPAWCIAPFEDARKIQGSRPKPVPPKRAPVMKLPDGRVAVERTGQAPLVVPVEEPAESEWPEVEATEAVVW